MTVLRSCETDTDITTYSLCGIGIEVKSIDFRATQLVQSRLRFIPTSPDIHPTVVFDIRDDQYEDFARVPQGKGRPVYDAPNAQIMYYEESDELFIDYLGAIRMLCRPSSGQIQSAIYLEEGRTLAVHPLFTIPLIEVFKRHQRYALHAACVAIGDSGLLISGPSGSGKSTLSSALLRTGFDFLTDDMVFLDGQSNRVWGLPDQIDMTDFTASMFPETSGLVGHETLPCRDKHAVDSEYFFGKIPIASCRPVALVLPQISGEKKSHIEEMSPSLALRALAPNIFLTEPLSSQAHFDALAQLANEVPAFSMSTGTDLDDAVANLKAIFA